VQHKGFLLLRVAIAAAAVAATAIAAVAVAATAIAAVAVAAIAPYGCEGHTVSHTDEEYSLVPLNSVILDISLDTSSSSRWSLQLPLSVVWDFLYRTHGLDCETHPILSAFL
jgi:hypothetical protein